MKQLLLFLFGCSLFVSCTKKLSPYSFTQHPTPAVALAPRSVAPPAFSLHSPSLPETIMPLHVASTPQQLYQAAWEEIRQMLSGD